MRWPWRRRGKGGRVVFIGSSPFDVRAALAAVPTPSPVVAAWIPDEPPTAATEPAAARAVVAPEAAPPAPATGPTPRPAVTPARATPPPSAPRPGVQLGFADGTVLTLDDDDPRAVALRATAARLTGTS